MLTTDQKEAILRRAGVAVPDFPPGHDIEALYVEYLARRAAKGLRDAEAARQLRDLQLAAASKA